MVDAGGFCIVSTRPLGATTHTYTLDGKGHPAYTGLPDEYPQPLHDLARGLLACDPVERLGLEATLAQLEALADHSSMCDTCSQLRAAVAEAESRAAALDADKVKAEARAAALEAAKLDAEARAAAAESQVAALAAGKTAAEARAAAAETRATVAETRAAAAESRAATAESRATAAESRAAAATSRASASSAVSSSGSGPGRVRGWNGSGW